MQTGELARRLGIEPRVLRYALEQGYVDRWIVSAAGSGNHRTFTDGQVFALGLLVQVIDSGLKAPSAAKVVKILEEGLRTVACGLGWDPEFRPFDGLLHTKKLWFADIAQKSAIRLSTGANPSRGGRIEAFDWTDIESHRTLSDFAPCVMVRIEISRFASLVRHWAHEQRSSVPDSGTKRKRQ